MAATNSGLFQYDGAMGYDMNGNRVPMPSASSYAAEERDRAAREAASMASHRRLVNIGRVASVAPFAAALAPGGALAGMYGGGAAAAAPGAVSLPAAATEGVGFSAAGPATSHAMGGMATLGKLFNSRGAELGVNAGLSLYGQHAQNKAADQARADALKGQQEAIALQRQQLEQEATNANLDREERKQLNDAINELKKRELDAAEEERSYLRTKDEQSEARLQPYRQISEQALRRLSSMWGLN